MTWMSLFQQPDTPTAFELPLNPRLAGGMRRIARRLEAAARRGDTAVPRQLGD